MVWCKCVTKPTLSDGKCVVCHREAAPHDERIEPEFDSEFGLVFQPA
jgi:hypothetical protein